MAINLICFDVDGTLIDDEDGTSNIWRQIHIYCGDEGLNDQRFDEFMRGDITYAEWVDLDIGDWQAEGVTEEMMLSAVSQLQLMNGARETAFELVRRGYRLAVISGSLNIGLDNLFPDHPFRPVFINRVFFHENGEISHWEATPFDLEHKSLALHELAAEEGLSLDECAFIGDNFNDIDVARAAGFSVAFNCKSPELETVASEVIHEKDLRKILPFFPMDS